MIVCVCVRKRISLRILKSLDRKSSVKNPLEFLFQFKNVILEKNKII